MDPLPLTPSFHPAQRCRPAAQLKPAGPEAGEDAGQQACGWFESSWDLQQGLAVSELPDSDGAVAALWFTQLDSSSARLQ